ncbi:tetratricopeptide repeat protein [Candidatus Poribacteria bacterium]|nr:tetratricopeptide repeat protein [Candidatus Poribacteria bacterium]
MNFAEKVLAFVACLAVGAFLSCASSIKQQSEKGSERPDLGQIARIGKAATVQIGSLSVEESPTLGSGFFVGHDLIVTNVHNINQKSFDGAFSVAKLVNKSTWYTIEGVMASDPKRDLVILKVKKVSGEDASVLSLGDSGTVKAGDRIIVIGNPGQDDKVLQGDVSVGSISRGTPNFLDLRARNYRKGYSGGPVLNIHGDVIGIAFQGHRIGAGYAIPSNYLHALLKDIPTQAKPLEKWREEPLVRYYSAVDAEGRGEFKDAIKVYDTVIRLAPDFADAYINRGDVRRKLGNLEEAIKDYNMAIRLGDDYAYVYVNRGIAKADLGDKKDAIKDYDSAIHLDSSYVDAYGHRASAKSDLGDKKGAIEDYNTVIRLKPEDDLLSLAYVNRGTAKSDLGDQKGAIEDYNTVIRLKPEDDLLSSAYVNRGIAKSDLGDKKGAIEDYNTAIRLKPESSVLALAYVNRGNAKTNLSDNKGAIEDCDTAIRLKPGDTILAVAYNIRGKAKSAHGDDMDSIIDYDKAIQLEPNHARFYYNRGVAKVALGRTSEAKTDFKTALKLVQKSKSTSRSTRKETGSENLKVHLDVSPSLKTDIEKALLDLE